MSVLTREPHTLRFDRYVIDRALRQWELTPSRIALIYVCFGVTALYVSDVFLVRRFSEPLLGQLQALKGGLEVLLTGALIFGLTRAKDAQVERTSERVQRQQEELRVLHRVLRHNLRNKLNIVMGIGEMLTEHDDGDVSRRGRLLTKTASEVLHYTEQAARIRRVTDEGQQTTEFDLVELIEEVVDHTDADVSVDLPESAGVRTNRMFREAVEELLANAIEHGGNESPGIHVSINSAAGPLHHVELCVSDNGSGIPQNVIDILSESEINQLSHLQGMGLWFVYWVVAESDGYLLIDENHNGGACVRVRVPAARVLAPERFDEVTGGVPIRG